MLTPAKPAKIAADSGFGPVSIILAVSERLSQVGANQSIRAEV
jgi:hypothetical protein